MAEDTKTRSSWRQTFTDRWTDGGPLIDAGIPVQLKVIEVDRDWVVLGPGWVWEPNVYPGESQWAPFGDRAPDGRFHYVNGAVAKYAAMAMLRLPVDPHLIRQVVFVARGDHEMKIMLIRSTP